MKVLFGFTYFGLAFHMLDAARQYWKDDEPFSFAGNFVWGISFLVLGLAILLH